MGKTYLFILTTLLISVSSQAGDICLQVFAKPASLFQNHDVFHSQAPMTFAGPWRFASHKYNFYARGNDPSTIGDYKVNLPTGTSYSVRDLHYDLGNGQVGLRLIPTVDNKNNRPMTEKTADGTVIEGSKLVDETLSEFYGLPKDQENPLFAFITYTHMEKDPAEEDVTQSRTTHMGGYIGKNQTRNSPQNYITQGTWHNREYPAHMTTMKLKGVKPEVLNSNVEISLSLLNKLNGGVIFPENYEFDYYRMINLEEVLAYWRGWNDPTWERFPGQGPYIEKLKTDKTYHCYCAEHITLAANVALNVPHNLEAYKKIWGAEAGADLFAKVSQNYKDNFKAELPRIAKFKTLWERDGVQDPTTEKEVGKSLAWNPLTTADLVYGLISQYSGLKEAGPLVSSLSLLKFASEANKRMGIEVADYMKMSLPVVVKMWQFDALTTLSQAKTPEAFHVAFQNYLQMIPVAYGKAMEGKPEATTVSGMLVPVIVESLKKSSVWIQANLNSNKDAVHLQFRQAVQTELAEARQLKPKLEPDESLKSGIKYVAYYSPPFVLGWIQNGYAAKHPEVELKTVFTTVPAFEVTKDSENPSGVSLERKDK